MSNILGGMESLKSQSIQELTLSKKTTYWFKSPTSLTLKVLGDELELRNLILAEIDVFLEIINCPHKLFTSCCFEHFHQARINKFPYTFFFRSVFKRWDWVTNFVVKSKL